MLWLSTCLIDYSGTISLQSRLRQILRKAVIITHGGYSSHSQKFRAVLRSKKCERVATILEIRLRVYSPMKHGLREEEIAQKWREKILLGLEIEIQMKSI